MLVPLLIACAPPSSPDKGDPPDPKAHTAVDTGTPPTTEPVPHSGGGDHTARHSALTPPQSDRDRLLSTFLDHLQTDPTRAQSGGLRGADLPDVCATWDAMGDAQKATFLTVTARLEGSLLADGSTMLSHVVGAWRIVGGEGAVGADPGSCGGGEYNRLILSMDPALHAALVAAHDNGGGDGGAGVPDLRDIPPGGAWRDSSDLAGAHDPFTASDDTIDGAPRGQVHFFRDPSAGAALQPLGRVDLEDLVDPLALEFDHDYDCIHDSNPLCEYTFYGPLCAPRQTRLGVDIYESGYGSASAAWRPEGC